MLLTGAYFIHEELSQLLLLEISVFEVQDDLAGVSASGAIIFIVHFLEERVTDGLVNGEAEEGVELQSLLQEVNCLMSCARELFSQVGFRYVFEALEVLDRLLVRDEAHLLSCWRSYYLEDTVQLVLCRKGKAAFDFYFLVRRRKREATLTWEQRLSVQEGGR